MRRTVEWGVHGRFARWMRKDTGRLQRGWTGFCLVLPFVSLIVFWLLDYERGPAPWFGVHERTHAEQARRYGFVGWWARYVWGWLRFGYRGGNPLENEARKAAGQL